MKKTDVDEKRIQGSPHGVRILFEGKLENQGHTITLIELRQYVERIDDRLGAYSLLTAFVQTKTGAVEMKYDEGFRGSDALDAAATMLQNNVGLASLINRALIEMGE